jgi:putative ABC transport system ATP-binding protein
VLTVRLRGICKEYRLGSTLVPALRGVDLDLEQGEMCALIGPSGSGKTTLLNVLGCLDVPSAGSYELDGQPIRARDFDDLADLRSRAVGFIFQTFNLVPVLDARENIELAIQCSGKGDARWRRERVDRLLEAVGLSRFEHHRPGQLSGGQQQRVAIARALAPSPRLILADEPTANLDTATATAILELLARLNREEQVTVLFSTHDPRVLTFARRRVYLRDGEIVRSAEDTPPAVASSS